MQMTKRRFSQTPHKSNQSALNSIVSFWGDLARPLCLTKWWPWIRLNTTGSKAGHSRSYSAVLEPARGPWFTRSAGRIAKRTWMQRKWPSPAVMIVFQQDLAKSLHTVSVTTSATATWLLAITRLVNTSGFTFHALASPRSLGLASYGTARSVHLPFSAVATSTLDELLNLTLYQ